MAQPKRYDLGDLPQSYRELLSSFERMLRARNRSPLTAGSYRTVLAILGGWLVAQGNTTLDIRAITKADLEAFFAQQLAERASSTVANRFGVIKVFFGWLAAEKEIPSDPTARLHRPTLPLNPPPIPTEDAIRRILAACAGNTFEARRDLALIRLLVDTGMRLKEVSGLTLDAIDFERNIATVGAKGTPGRERLCPFGAKAALALDRYLRARRTHRCAQESALWLGLRGGLSAKHLYRIVKARAAAAGCPELHPHLFRHAFAHLWMQGGGRDVDLLELAGWKSHNMLRRYGAALAGERARDAHRLLSPGDRF